jgi:hypothetical protein
MTLHEFFKFADDAKPAVECAALIFGAFGLRKFLLERTDRATDVLLELETHFEKCKEGREYVSVQSKYDQLEKELEHEAEPSSGYGPGEEALDNMLRFYVVLHNVRRVGQVSDVALSTSYRYWLAQYYRKNRTQLRRYVDVYYPTLSAWLIDDTSRWRRWLDRPVFASKRPFFGGEHFWSTEDLELDTRKLREQAHQAVRNSAQPNPPLPAAKPQPTQTEQAEAAPPSAE